MRDTFTLANVLPQDSDNNQDLWVTFEDAARRLGKHCYKLDVVSGPLFKGHPVEKAQLTKPAIISIKMFESARDIAGPINEVSYYEIGESRVARPPYLYKAMRCLKDQHIYASAFVVRNTPGSKEDQVKPLLIHAVPIEQIRAGTGLSLPEFEGQDLIAHWPQFSQTKAEFDMTKILEKTEKASTVIDLLSVEGLADRKKSAHVGVLSDKLIAQVDE